MDETESFMNMSRLTSLGFLPFASINRCMRNLSHKLIYVYVHGTESLTPDKLSCTLRRLSQVSCLCPKVTSTSIIESKTYTKHFPTNICPVSFGLLMVLVNDVFTNDKQVTHTWLFLLGAHQIFRSTSLTFCQTSTSTHVTPM